MMSASRTARGRQRSFARAARSAVSSFHPKILKAATREGIEAA
jgi:hypothetical protein